MYNYLNLDFIKLAEDISTRQRLAELGVLGAAGIGGAVIGDQIGKRVAGPLHRFETRSLEKAWKALTTNYDANLAKSRDLASRLQWAALKNVHRAHRRITSDAGQQAFNLGTRRVGRGLGAAALGGLAYTGIRAARPEPEPEPTWQERLGLDRFGLQ